jgi:uncharacterized protein
MLSDHLSTSDILQKVFTAFEQEDYENSFLLALPLAEAGVLEAQSLIAGMYLGGKGTAQNTEKAIHWYRLSAYAGDPVSQNNYACLILHESPLEAIRWYECAAQKDVPFAADCLGDIYAGFTSVSSIETNDAIAIQWYQIGVNNGSSMSCYRLASMYAFGRGVAQNHELAIDYYQKASKSGITEAQKVLDYFHLYGQFPGVRLTLI